MAMTMMAMMFVLHIPMRFCLFVMADPSSGTGWAQFLADCNKLLLLLCWLFHSKLLIRFWVVLCLLFFYTGFGDSLESRSWKFWRHFGAVSILYEIDKHEF